MQYIFYLSGQQLDAYLVKADGMDRLGEFPDTSAGHSSFSEFLAEQQPLPCRLLVDLIEEEFREETIPHVSGSDRTALHNRHAARLFRNTPFRHSEVISRDKTGRRDDHVLFSSLTNKDIIEPWLNIISQHQLPLAGIHSLPVITRRLADTINASSDCVLLITRQRGNNLRETFIKNKQVRFSRLAPLLDCDRAAFGAIVDAEIEKTKRYLNTLKLLDFNEHLDVFIISDQDHLASAQTVCNNKEQINYFFHDTNDIARQLGMEAYQDSQFSDRIFIHLLCKKRNPNHYAQAEHLFHYRTYNTARALNLFSTSLALAAVLWCGINIADAFVFKQETKLLQASIEKVEDNLRQITGASQNEDINPENILAAVKISEALKQRSTSPDPLMRALGAALLQNPGLILDKLVWHSKQTTAQPAPDAEDTTAGQINSADNSLQSVIVAEGHIADFKGSYLDANNDIQLFVRKLSTQPGIVSASITRYPINTASGTSLVGKLLSNENPGKANFTVRVVMEMQRGQG